MQYDGKWYPCRYCSGMVRFFKWFHDSRGVIHYANTVFVKCTNSDCPGRGGDSENTAE